MTEGFGPRLGTAARRPEGEALIVRTRTFAVAKPDALQRPSQPRPLLFQAKLRISQAGDASEQEADRIAARVMRSQASPTPCACGGEGSCPKCGGAGKASASAGLFRTAVTAPARYDAPPLVREVLSAPGAALDPASRAFFEPRFGHDFRNVRIHADDRAGASASAVDARAYTVGRDVVFAPGQFAPGSEDGRRLLAHELAHVVQQTAGGTPELARIPTEGGARDGRYTFSTNCGWIDWSHANPSLTQQLIQRVQQASDALRAAGTAATPTTGRFSTPTMTSGAAGVVLSSASLRVRLLRPLSASEVNEVALSIFRTISMAFEMQQLWTDFVASSSFAQEDLPSNLIAFYMAVRGFSRQDIITFCGGLDAAGSVAEYQRNHNFVRNFSFTPVGATGPWPAELSTINDSAAASLYETERIFATQGTDTFSFCPMYRVVGTIGETDLFILSVGGKTFRDTDDLRVVPTFRARPTTSGRYGHVNSLQVRPARSSDEAKLRAAGLSWPFDVPEPVLQCLTSQGNPG